MAMAPLLLAGAMGSCGEEAQPPIVMPEGIIPEEIGDGTWQKPLQCWQANKGTTVDGRTSNWVTGYIVGTVDTSVSSTMKEESFAIGVPCSSNTNMVIAQYPYDPEVWAEKNYTWKDCVTVQLPSGNVRNSLNLVDNPGNFNKQVSLRGTTGSKYCGAYGVRSTADFNWGPEGRYEDPITEIGANYYCDFTQSGDINYFKEWGWKTVNTKGGLTGWYVKNNNGEQFATCSAYLGTEFGGPYENWLVSPGIDIDNATAKTVSFETQAGYTTTSECNLTVYVLTKPSPKSCEPVQLHCVIARAPASGFSKLTESGTIDLSQFSGKIYIGFRYFAEAGGQNNSTEFHITNFNLGGATPPPDPDAMEVTPPTDKTFKLATEIKSGKWYALTHGNMVAQPVEEEKSYGYLVGKSFIKVTSDSFVTSSLNAFLFTKEGEGYTIRDHYGRFLYLDSNPTHVSFQVSTKRPYANYKWKAEIIDGVVKLTNEGRDNVIEWSTQYKNFTTVVGDDYAGGGPVLYEMQ